MLFNASYSLINFIVFCITNIFSSLLILDKSSSSVSHLVENELPLASVNIASTSTFEKRTRSSTGSQDINEIEVASEQENQNHKINGTTTATEFMYYQHENPSPLDGEAEKKKPVNASQNVYSNIPSSPSSNFPNILKNAASDHVYSNIDETVTVNGGGGASVRFLSDNSDLDLDDPLLTSSFIKKKEIPNNNQQNIYTSNSSSSHGVPHVGEPSQSSKMILPSISSSSSTNGTQVTSIELKNVLSAVALQKNSNNKQDQAQISSSSIPIGPALHRQETMIDTALDLDSLDGSSQVGLMKAL
jgi:hypothetical protein